jgi:hypothetical protein
LPALSFAGASLFPPCFRCLHAVANTPAGLMELVRSYDSISFGLPRNRGGSAPALVFSRPAQRLLTLRPARSPSRHCDLLHQRLQQSHCLHCCSDCYRVERTSSRGVYSRCGPPPFHGAPDKRTCAYPVDSTSPKGWGRARCARTILDHCTSLESSSMTRPSIGAHNHRLIKNVAPPRRTAMAASRYFSDWATSSNPQPTSSCT